jgi:hypothetical protein
MVMRGGLRSGTGTAPMAKRAAVGRLGVREALTVQAAWQPAIMAQPLKAMPTGPKRTQSMMTMPAIQRRRIGRLMSPLSEEECEGFSTCA